MNNVIEKIKHLDYKSNKGYVVYLIIVNIIIVITWYSILNTVYLEKVSDFMVDGTDFSILINPLMFLVNLIIVTIGFLISTVVLFILIIVSTLIFNRLYFKKSEVERLEKDKRIYDIKGITLLISVITFILIVVTNKFWVSSLLFISYLIISLIPYYLTVARIEKIYKPNTK